MLARKMNGKKHISATEKVILINTEHHQNQSLSHEIVVPTQIPHRISACNSPLIGSLQNDSRRSDSLHSPASVNGDDPRCRCQS